MPPEFVTQGFFSDLIRERVAPRRAARKPKLVSAPRRTNPCAGCPGALKDKVEPLVPDGATCVLVAERSKSAGADATLSAAGIDSARVGWVKFPYCSVTGEGLGKEARKKCAACLVADLPPDVPAVAYGDEPLYALLRSREHGAAYWRGLWTRAPDRRRVYVLDPATPKERFVADLERLARTLESPVRPELRRLEVVADPRERPDLMAWLAAHPGPWAFDIETYDAGAFPSRQDVSTDPCHPDFRVRGVAVAWAEDEGAWLELAPLGPDAWRPYLAPVFASPASKAAQGGHFDEEGLVYPGWVPEVWNRDEDSMLSMVSLSDGRHASLRLERIAVDVLGVDQWWEEFDKSEMRDAPLEQVARAAVFDAGLSLWIVTHAADMRAAGEYWEG